MKVIIIKQHPHYPLGEADVTEERGKYLIRIGVATGDLSVRPKEKVVKPTHKKEKKEIKAKKEKVVKT